MWDVAVLELFKEKQFWEVKVFGVEERQAVQEVDVQTKKYVDMLSPLKIGVGG